MFNKQFQQEMLNIFNGLEEEYSTVNIQKMALFEFLGDLGYVPANGVTDFSRGAKQIKNKFLPSELSLVDAVGLYNGNVNFVKGLGQISVTSAWFFPRDEVVDSFVVRSTDGHEAQIKEVFENRLTNFIYLQYSNKKKAYSSPKSYLKFSLSADDWSIEE